MLSETETQRLRAEVHAAVVARQYDLARAKLQELAQRSRGVWSWPSQTPPVASPPRASWWTRQRRLRQVVTGLLLALIAGGVGDRGLLIPALKSKPSGHKLQA